MATRRDIEVGLILLRRAGYSTARVASEHQRLCDYARIEGDTPIRVSAWLEHMPTVALTNMYDRLAERGPEDRSLLDADRLLAALDLLLPEETLVKEAATFRVHSPAYAVRLDTLTADTAARTLAALMSGRRTAALAPVALLDASYLAVRMLELHEVPDVGHSPFIEPVVRALRATVLWLLTQDGQTDTEHRLRRAFEAANW